MRPRLRRRQVRTLATIFIALAPAAVGAGEPRPQHRGRAEFVARNRPAAPGRRGAHRRGRLRRSWEGALPVHREGRPFARRPEGRRRCMPPPAMPFRRSLRSPASAAPAFSAINGASPTLLPPWGSPFYLQGGLRSAAQRVRRIARTLSSRRNAGRDHADRAGRSCGVRSVQPVHVPHRKCGRCRSPHPWGRGRCDDRRTFAPSDDRHRMPAPGAFRRRRLSRRACRTADAEARSVRTAAASYRFPQLFFSLRRSSQVCFRRRNLCRRPLFGADVRCARPVRRNGLAPHPFPRADARMGGPNPDVPPCILPRPLPPGAPVSGDCGTRRSVSCMYPLSRSSEDRDRKEAESAAAGEF